MSDIYTLGKAMRDAQRAWWDNAPSRERAKAKRDAEAAFDKALAASPVVAGEYDVLIERLRTGNGCNSRCLNFGVLYEAADALAAMQAQRDEAAAALFAEVRRNDAAQARIAALTEALELMMNEFRQADLPYGSAAYRAAGAALKGGE